MTNETPPTADNTTDNVVDLFAKKDRKTSGVELIESPPVPEPQTYFFRLFDGTEREVTGMLAISPPMIMIGDEAGLLTYMAPVDSIVEMFLVGEPEAEVVVNH